MARAESARDLSPEPSMKRVVVGLMVGGAIAVLCFALWLRPAAAPLTLPSAPPIVGVQSNSVVPAEAGTQGKRGNAATLDSRFRGNGGEKTEQQAELRF